MWTSSASSFVHCIIQHNRNLLPCHCVTKLRVLLLYHACYGRCGFYHVFCLFLFYLSVGRLPMAGYFTVGCYKLYLESCVTIFCCYCLKWYTLPLLFCECFLLVDRVNVFHTCSWSEYTFSIIRRHNKILFKMFWVDFFLYYASKRNNNKQWIYTARFCK